jgi:proteasome lid subunit RPN8/RPN11
MQIQSENVLVKWPAAECPFIVEYSPRVLDDIRLAVTDAFFSLPRGGAEIGGVLLGRQEKGRISIVDSVPMECEHAFGPSFVLSDRDQAKLAELVASGSRNPHARPLGWWHSHTRSDIFLSEADLQVYNSYFPESSQVALVLKPHTFQPTRAGFFFREPDGSIHAASSYHEVVLDPLPMRTVVPGGPPVRAMQPSGITGEAASRVIDVAGFANPDAEPSPAEEERAEVAPPSFLGAAEAPRESRRWIGWVAAAFGVTLAIVAYSTRDRWVGPVQARLQPTASDAIELNAIDHTGQLQVRWNGAAPAVRSASGGSLLILDGTVTVNVPLDGPHVQSGAFTYLRKADRVDVTLALAQPGGKEMRVATLFTGAPPPKAAISAPAPAPETASPPAVSTAERDALRKENAGLKIELARQIDRNKLLEKGLEELRKAVQHEQQRKRLEAQDPAK